MSVMYFLINAERIWKKFRLSTPRWKNIQDLDSLIYLASDSNSNVDIREVTN